MCILEKFENIEINDNILSEEDVKELNIQEKNYIDFYVYLTNLRGFIDKNYPASKDYKYSELKDAENAIHKEQVKYFESIYFYIERTYKVKLNKDDSLFEKYKDTCLDYRVFVKSIASQLNGFSLKDTGVNTLIKSFKDIFQYRFERKEEYPTLSKNRVSLPKFVWYSTWGKPYFSWGDKRDKILLLLNTLMLVEFNAAEIQGEYKSLLEKWCDSSIGVYTTAPYSLPDSYKVESMRFYQNGKVEIKFRNPLTAAEYFQKFINQ